MWQTIPHFLPHLAIISWQMGCISEGNSYVSALVIATLPPPHRLFQPPAMAIGTVVLTPLEHLFHALGTTVPIGWNNCFNRIELKGLNTKRGIQSSLFMASKRLVHPTFGVIQ